MARLAGHRGLTALAAGAAEATEAAQAATAARHADEGRHQTRHPHRLNVGLGQVSVQLRESTNIVSRANGRSKLA